MPGVFFIAIFRPMKALVKSKAEKGIWMEDVPEPEVGMNDVLIKVLKTAICGTDLHIYLWNEWAAKTIPVPMVIGHEFVGEIVEVGSGVSNMAAGDAVTGPATVIEAIGGGKRAENVPDHSSQSSRRFRVVVLAGDDVFGQLGSGDRCL